MSQIILDLGSGNTCKNDIDIARRMIDEVAAIDTKKHEVVFKMQLFEEAPPNVPLDKGVYWAAMKHAQAKGYRMTASVFDLTSLNFLLRYDIPFVKIACRPELYWLIGEVPRKVPVYVSVPAASLVEILESNVTKLICVPHYPAKIEDYPSVPQFSDHTVGLDLYHFAQPKIWEKHLKLPDSTGPDAGPFAITPDELKEIL
jgi:sialic acid synthase SpsE